MSGADDITADQAQPAPEPDSQTEPRYYTLKEAMVILGRRTDGAVRKMFERGTLKGFKDEEKNRTMVWLDSETVKNNPSRSNRDEEDEDEDEDSSTQGWHRLADTLEAQAAAAATEAAFLRQALENERSQREKERAEWNRQMSLERAARDAERAHWTAALSEVTAHAKAARESAERERAARLNAQKPKAASPPQGTPNAPKKLQPQTKPSKGFFSNLFGSRT